MTYWARVHNQAFGAALRSLGIDSLERAAIRMALGIVAILLLVFLAGPESAESKWITAVAAIFAIGLILPVVYIWKFFAIPPLLAENETSALQAKIDFLTAECESLRKIGPDLEGRIENLVSGIQETREAYLLIVFMKIFNRGSAPSSVDDWSATFEDKGQIIPAKLVHIESMHFNQNGQDITLRSANSIYNLAATPIPAGGHVQGHVILTLPYQIFEQRSVDSRIRIRFFDIRRTRHEAIYTQGRAGLRYMPGMEFTDEKPRNKST